MSRCKACDRGLSDFESTRKTIDSERGKVEYIDLCNRCFKSVSEEVAVVERVDLATEDDISMDDEDNYPSDDNIKQMNWMDEQEDEE